MDHQFLAVVVPLFAAHLVADFLTQSDRDVREKYRPPVLLKHALKVGVLSYFLLGMFGAWDLVLGVTLTHLLVDALKVRSRKGSYLSRFFYDQGAHLLILTLFGWAAAHFRHRGLVSIWEAAFGPVYYQAVALGAGALLTIYVGSFVVEHLFQSLDAGGEPASREDRDWVNLGLREGGRVIGYLERALILVFVLAGHPAGIGFLIAAKSIFRFGELTDQDRRQGAEYIIIGTLMSVLFGTAGAFLTAAVLEILS